MNQGKSVFLVGFIVIFAIILRIFNISELIWDRHYFRQTDTYAIALNFLESGDYLRPQFYQTPNPENINGWYFGELPVYEYLMVGVFKIFGESLVLARTINIALSAIGVVLAYLMGARLWNRKTGYFAALFFAILPPSVFWGRAITPDWLALVAFMAAIVIITRKPSTRKIFLSSILMTLAVTTKPFYFVFFPALFFLFADFHKIKLNEAVKNSIFVYVLPAVIFVLWRIWAATFPEFTIDPDIGNLLHNNLGWWRYWQESNWILLFWQKHFFGELHTTLGGILVVLGLILLWLKKSPLRRMATAWILGCLAVTYIFSWGSKTHDYYLLHWLSITPLLMGVSANWLLVELKKYYKSSHRFNKNILLNIIGGGAVVFLIYFFGIQQNISYIKAYFEPQGYELWNQKYSRSFKNLKPLIPKDSLIISILREYSPLVNNNLRIRGSIFVVSEIEPCPPTTIISDMLEHRSKLGAEYLVVDAKNSPWTQCKREEILSLFDSKFESIYEDSSISVYRIENATMKVSGNGGKIIIETENVGNEVELEVGGIPGTHATVALPVSWIKTGENQYQAEFTDTADWQSFKLYYQSPQIQMEHPDWMLQNDFVVRK